jgi:hypothetical protein
LRRLAVHRGFLQWDSLFNALKQARQVSIVVEL